MKKKPSLFTIIGALAIAAVILVALFVPIKSFFDLSRVLP